MKVHSSINCRSAQQHSVACQRTGIFIFIVMTPDLWFTIVSHLWQCRVLPYYGQHLKVGLSCRLVSVHQTLGAATLSYAAVGKLTHTSCEGEVSDVCLNMFDVCLNKLCTTETQWPL